MMKLWLALIFVIYSTNIIAQTDDAEEPLVARVLALDTNITIAKRFSEAIGGVATGYSLAFIDNETRYTVRYVFKNQKNETLRIDYKYIMESDDEDAKAPKKPVVTFQKISGELTAITQIYNFLFSANFTRERLMTSATQGTPVKYNDKTCNFIFEADDYEPGYWVMTFVR